MEKIELRDAKISMSCLCSHQNNTALIKKSLFDNNPSTNTYSFSTKYFFTNGYGKTEIYLKVQLTLAQYDLESSLYSLTFDVAT